MLFSLPSVPDVRAQSKLRPEQFDARLSSAAFDAQIEKIIVAAGDYVTDAILEACGGLKWPFTAAQIASVPSLADFAAGEIERQNRLAQSATALEALARIWEEAGALNDEYDEESDRRRKDAEREVEALQSAISRVVSGVQNAVVDAPKRRFRRQGTTSTRLQNVS